MHRRMGCPLVVDRDIFAGDCFDLVVSPEILFTLHPALRPIFPKHETTVPACSTCKGDGRFVVGMVAIAAGFDDVAVSDIEHLGKPYPLRIAFESNMLSLDMHNAELVQAI